MNYFLHYIVFALTSCITIIPVHSMDIVENMEQKPTIRGQMFITSEYYGIAARYAPKEFHLALCDFGVQSWIQVPVINISVLVTNADGSVTNWVNDAPILVKKYETEEINRYAYEGVISFARTIKRYADRRFPYFMPSLYLYSAKTGSELSFTIHGYPTQLTCINSQDPLLQNQSFEECYKKAIHQFITSPGCLCSSDDLQKCEDTLIELGIIEKIGRKQYLHGKNGFVSIEKLICDRIKEKNTSIYFLLCLVHAHKH